LARPHGHQLEMLRVAAAGDSALLIAPTGGGKSLAGFLWGLVDLDRQGGVAFLPSTSRRSRALTTELIAVAME
jgi:Lhr-like helicase